MEDISPWKSLASDGVSASVHSAKGVEGNGARARVRSRQHGRLCGCDAPVAADAAGGLRDLVLDARRGGPQQLRGQVRRCLRRQRVVVPPRELSVLRRLAAGAHQATPDRFRVGPDEPIARCASSQSIEFVAERRRRRRQGQPVVRPAVAEAAAAAERATAPPTATRVVRSERRRRRRSPSTARRATAWRSARAGAATQTLEIDLQAVREFGGIEIDWARGLHAPRYTIETSLDGSSWQTVRSVEAGNGGRDSHLPAGVRGALHPADDARIAGRDVGIAELYVRDLEFGASPNAFISSLAKQAPRGCYPRAYLGEQIVLDDRRRRRRHAKRACCPRTARSKSRKGSFSIEPFVRDARGLADVGRRDDRHSLADGYLPIPSVDWKHRDRSSSRPPRTRAAQSASAYVHARLPRAQSAQSRQQVTLALAVRPFQVNPPAQFLNTAGGVSRIQDLAFESDRVSVDGTPRCVSADAAARVSRSPARRRTRRATGCATNAGRGARPRRQRLRVGRAAVRRRSARPGRASEIVARSAAACDSRRGCARSPLDAGRSRNGARS